jgi:hypothetical protein
MPRPRLELGSRTDLVLAGYKPAALPIELPERTLLRIGDLNFRFAIRNSIFAIPSWCARRDSNPPPRFKRPVLRHQSFGRMVLAAGFEPALTALEEQRLLPLGHASNSSGDEGTRTLDSLVDNQVHWPLCYIPVAASAGIEPAISCSRDRRLSHFAYDAIKYRLQELNPDSSANRADVLPITPRRRASKNGSGRRPRTFTLRFQRPACCQLHHPGTSTNGETRTRDLLVHSQTLYPAKLRSQPTMAGMERLELSKPGLKNLLLDRFAFIPVSVPFLSDRIQFVAGSHREHSIIRDKLKFVGHFQCGRGESNS